MIATSGFLAALECTKFVFVQGSAPHSAVDPTSKVKGERGGEMRGSGPLTQIPGSAPILFSFASILFRVRCEGGGAVAGCTSSY